MFSHPALLWFLPILGLVLLIHLINMFRHRRVEWGALEFLLASYRKSRVRILLQQLLLMILRTLAVAAVILMLADPKFEGPWADLFVGKPTHHLILLDDSYSMNDRNAAQGGSPLFEDALGVVRRIVDGAVKRDVDDRITLVRLSKASAIERGEEPDLAELPLNREGSQIVREVLETLTPSESADDPERLFAAALPLLQHSAVRFKPVVYFISDFRSRNWKNPDSILKHLDEVGRRGGLVRMIRAADEVHPNLGIDRIDWVDGIHAADIDMLLDVTIVNHGPDDAENVHMTVWVDDQLQPSLTIPKIRSGERTVPPVRFPVRSGGPGRHRVEVQLQPDAIPDDNRRFLVMDVPEALEILLVSPEDRSTDSIAPSQYVRVALSPGGTKSGIHTRIEPPSFLSGNPLKSFSAVFLLDVPVPDAAAIRALEEYVGDGGGAAFFFGPENSLPGNIERIGNELYKNGEGLIPFAPGDVATLDPDFLSRTPDIVLDKRHPVFRLFDEGESPLLSNVRIERYFTVVPGSAISDPIASLRNGAPLVLEKQFGKGRTLSFLTSVSPDWNNWARGNPSFVVVMLELAAWLSKRSEEPLSFLIGDSIAVPVDTTLFDRKIRLRAPSQKSGETVTEGAVVDLEAVGEVYAAGRLFSPATTLSGFYEATLKRHTEGEVNKSYAVNVDPREGETGLIDLSALSDSLRSSNVTLESAAGFSASFDFSGDRPWSDFLLYAVVLMLVAEIFLAGRILPPTRSARTTQSSIPSA